jgi:hypothetical protein
MDSSIVIGVIFVIIGLVLLLMGIAQVKKAKAAATWPVIPGVVLSSGLQEKRHRNAKTHRVSVTYEPQIQYQYALMGQNYTGSAISFGSTSYDYNTASRKLALYPQGAPVQVHYDPIDPSKAVLEPKASDGVVLVVLGIVFMLVGAAITILILF